MGSHEDAEPGENSKTRLVAVLAQTRPQMVLCAKSVMNQARSGKRDRRFRPDPRGRVFVKKVLKSAALLLPASLVAISGVSFPVHAQLADGGRGEAADNTPLPELNVADIIHNFGLI